MKNKEIFKKYFIIFILSNGIILILRLLEWLITNSNYGFKASTNLSELVGSGYDLLFINVILTILYPKSKALNKSFYNILNNINRISYDRPLNHLDFILKK